MYFLYLEARHFFFSHFPLLFLFFQSTQLNCGGEKTLKGWFMVEVSKEWMEMQRNRGKGCFEKTLILLFSQSSVFFPEDERA